MDHCNWPFLETTMSMSSCSPYPGVGEVALRYVALVHHGPPLYDYWLSCWILLLFLLTAIKGCLSEFNIFLWTTTFKSTRNQNSWVKNNSFSSWADDYQKDPIHLKREIIMLDIARKWLKRRRCGNMDKWSVRNESALLFTGGEHGGWWGSMETFLIMWDIVILPGHGLFFFSFKIFFEILRDFDILPKSSGHVTSGANELALPF